MKIKSRFPSVLSVSAFGVMTFLTSDALAGQGPQPGICNRACWVARAPTCGITQMAALNRAIIHHTAGASDYSTDINTSKAKVRGVQNIHINNGWCDIAYHFLVDGAGNIFEGRSGSLGSLPRGTHDGNNLNSFGFNCLGYYHPPYNHVFSSAQRNSLEAVIAWRMPSAWSPYGSGTYNGNSVGFLDGHYKVKATACPGDGIIPSIAGIRDGVNCRKNGGCGTPPPPPYAPGDFTGNARTDYVLFRPSTATWMIRDSAGTGNVTSYAFGNTGDIPLIGHWSSATAAEFALFRPSTGSWYVRFLNGTVSAPIAWGQNGDIPLIGAWSGQMRDQAVFRPSNGSWYIRFGDTGLTTTIANWGQSGDVPMIGAWSGQMRDQTIYRPSNGMWYVRFGDTGNTSSFGPWGNPGDIPLLGAWSGLMRDSVVFRPSEGKWYIRLGSTGTTINFAFGQNGDVPMVGNIFGNGIIDQILFRPSTGTWYVRNGQTGTVYNFAFGQNGDQLVREQ